MMIDRPKKDQHFTKFNNFSYNFGEQMLESRSQQYAQFETKNTLYKLSIITIKAPSLI